MADPGQLRLPGSTVERYLALFTSRSVPGKPATMPNHTIWSRKQQGAPPPTGDEGEHLAPVTGWLDPPLRLRPGVERLAGANDQPMLFLPDQGRYLRLSASGAKVTGL